MYNLYLSFDVEADGSCPLLNNMLSLGIAGYDSNGKEIVSFQRNILPIKGHEPEQRCMDEFWSKEPEAWIFVNTNRVTPQKAMGDLADLLTNLKKSNWKIIWVARPAAYDWQWIKNYYDAFAPKNAPPIGYSAKCLSTMWWLYVKQNNLCKEEDSNMWKTLTEGFPHTHNPLDDARSQGTAFIKLSKLMTINL
jgi:hypothetical protein